MLFLHASFFPLIISGLPENFIRIFIKILYDAGTMHIVEKFLICLAFWGLPIVALFRGKGVVIVFFLFCLALGKHIYAYIRHQNGSIFFLSIVKNKLLLSFGLFFIWGLLSFLWADSSLKDFLHYIRLLLLLGAGGCCVQAVGQLTVTEKLFITKIFLVAYLFYFVFFLSEMVLGGFFAKTIIGKAGFCMDLYMRGAVILGFLFWPFILSAQHTLKRSILSKIFVMMVFTTVLFMLKNTKPTAAFIALAFSAGVFFLSFYMRATNFFLRIGTVMLAWVSPFLFLYLINPIMLFDKMHLFKQSFQHRLQMWYELAKLIVQRPILGYGFNGVPKIQDKLYLHMAYANGQDIANHGEVLHIQQYDWGKWVTHKGPIFGTHAHNGFIQVWFEFGAIGVLFLSFIVWFVLKKIRQVGGSFAQAICMAVFASYLIIWTVSFGIWQTWMLSLLFLNICLVMIMTTFLKDS